MTSLPRPQWCPPTLPPCRPAPAPCLAAGPAAAAWVAAWQAAAVARELLGCGKGRWRRRQRRGAAALPWRPAALRCCALAASSRPQFVVDPGAGRAARKRADDEPQGGATCRAMQPPAVFAWAGREMGKDPVEIAVLGEERSSRAESMGGSQHSQAIHAAPELCKHRCVHPQSDATPRCVHAPDQSLPPRALPSLARCVA